MENTWVGSRVSFFIRRSSRALSKLLPLVFGAMPLGSRAGFYDSSVSLGLRYYVRNEAL